jgi:hypothetical protein
MNTTHWLELWTPLSAYYETYRALGLRRPHSPPRALLKLFEQSYPSDPNWFEIDEILDRHEAAQEKISSLGISPHSVSLWISTQHEDEAGELNLDPLILHRLGDQGIKLCWICHQHAWDSSAEESTYPGVPVNIRDLSSEPDQQASDLIRRVYVSLDDDTLWEASITTYQQMYLQWARGTGPVQVGTYWQPSVIVVPNFSEEAIEYAVSDLLRKQQFEQAFTCLAGDPVPAPHLDQSRLTLDIMHHGQSEAQLHPLSHQLELTPQLKPNLWSISQKCFPQQLPELTTQWILHIREQMKTLQNAGIQRKDLVLTWHLPYEERYHLEIEPELMAQIANQGLSLRLHGVPQNDWLRRCLDE